MSGQMPVNLLWTAGFDSTFRLLDLLEGSERTIRPLYVINLERRSHPLELRRLGELRRRIAGRFAAPERLLPLEVRMRGDFPVSSEIDAAFRSLAASVHIGTQYAWLAQICRDLGFGPGSVELCMPKHVPPSDLQRAIFEDPHAPAPRLKSEAARVLFSAYSFPTLGLTKAAMQREAGRRGFADILDATWFCHRPIRGKPCGQCNPCRIAKKERTGITYSRLGRLRNLRSYGRSWVTRLVRRRVDRTSR